MTLDKTYERLTRSIERIQIANSEPHTKRDDRYYRRRNRISKVHTEVLSRAQAAGDRDKLQDAVIEGARRATERQ
jgi:hypothetical protein